MIAINANRFFHLAAACSALLLSGVLAAQTADAPKPRKDHDEPYLDHDADVANLNKPGRRAQPQKKDSDQLPPVDGGAVDQDYGDDRQQIGTLDPVPQPAALELSQRIDDAGAHLTLRRDGNEAFLGAVLAAFSDELVQYAEDLPPILGRSAIVFAGIADVQLQGFLRDPRFDGVQIFVQGVCATERGVQATDVQRVDFDRSKR